MKEIILLGSTGSVGRNVLDVVSRYPEKFRMKALATGRNIAKLVEQAERFSPDVITVGDAGLLDELKKKGSRGSQGRGRP